MSKHPRYRRHFALGAAVALGIVSSGLLAGCGAKDDGAAGSATPSPSATVDPAVEAQKKLNAEAAHMKELADELLKNVPIAKAIQVNLRPNGSDYQVRIIGYDAAGGLTGAQINEKTTTIELLKPQIDDSAKISADMAAVPIEQWAKDVLTAKGPQCAGPRQLEARIAFSGKFVTAIGCDPLPGETPWAGPSASHIFYEGTQIARPDRSKNLVQPAQVLRSLVPLMGEDSFQVLDMGNFGAHRPGIYNLELRGPISSLNGKPCSKTITFHSEQGPDHLLPISFECVPTNASNTHPAMAPSSAINWDKVAHYCGRARPNGSLSLHIDNGRTWSLSTFGVDGLILNILPADNR